MASSFNCLQGLGRIQYQRERLVAETTKALEDFRNTEWRCEAVDNSGRRCRNYWQGHDKGHQFHGNHRNRPRPVQLDSLGSDVDIRFDDFRASFDDEGCRQDLWRELSSLDNGNGTDIKAELASRARTCGVNQITSQRTCLSCLSNCPTNVLPCRTPINSRPGSIYQNIQHAICEACVRRYAGPPSESSFALISRCPLGCELSRPPWRIRIKPTTAGPRLLALDG